jgi:hypothetical protein
MSLANKPRNRVSLANKLAHYKRKVGHKMTTLNRNEVVEYLIENDFCLTDKICVFCSSLTDGWNAICYPCREYKGMMNIVEAVEYYGIEILPN